MRKLLKEWDDGLVSRAEFECNIHDLFLDPFLEYVEKGETYMRFGSCCCRFTHVRGRRWNCAPHARRVSYGSPTCAGGDGTTETPTESTS